MRVYFWMPTDFGIYESCAPGRLMLRQEIETVWCDHTCSSHVQVFYRHLSYNSYHFLVLRTSHAKSLGMMGNMVYIFQFLMRAQIHIAKNGLQNLLFILYLFRYTTMRYPTLPSFQKPRVLRGVCPTIQWAPSMAAPEASQSRYWNARYSASM